jgi:hypothetical protein
MLTVQEDVGIYTCTATNTEGKIHAVLEVAGKDSLSIYFSKYSRPRFSIAPRYVNSKQLHRSKKGEKRTEGGSRCVS